MNTVPTTYTRPRKTEATAIGQRNRRRWSRLLRNTLFELVPTVDLMLAQETSANSARRFPWNDRPSWVSIRIRIDQMAAIELLQRRHLKATGKEISRAEVLAALMAAGLGIIVNHETFGGNGN